MNSSFILVLAIVLAAVVIAVLFNLGTSLATREHTDAPEKHTQ